MRTFSQMIPVESARQFLIRTHHTLGGGFKIKRRSINKIRTSLDRFTPPDPLYKMEQNEFVHLDESMTDREALEILVSLMETIQNGSVGTQSKLPDGEFEKRTLLTVINQCMIGLWLEHEQIPFELLTKAYRFLNTVAVMAN